MGALIKLIICLYLLSLLFSLFLGLCRFLIDVRKWHKAEKKVIITKSAERSDYNGRNGSTGNNSGADRKSDRESDGESGTGNDNTDTDRKPLFFGT